MLPDFHVKAFLHQATHTFTYIVSDPVTKVAVIIDPVSDFDANSGRSYLHHAKLISDWILDHRLCLEWVLETHAHADHLSAAPYFKEVFGARIAIGEHITQVQSYFKSWFHFGDDFADDGRQFDRLLADNEEIHLGSLSIRAIHTPGHTPADMTYVVNDQAAFIGDTLFMPDVGTARCDFPSGCAHTLYQSILRIYELGDETDLYVCHDYPGAVRSYQHKVTVAEQKETNIHVNKKRTEDEFVALRQTRDASLPMPALLIQSIQVNLRAGKFPKPESNGVSYLKFPLNSPFK